MAMAPATLHQGDLNLAEYVAQVLVLVAAYFVRRSRWILPLPSPRRPWHAAAALAAGTMALRFLLIPWMPVPVPGVHDEFSYLLQGDTFAHGHLTNPTHPMWRFFESMHIFHVPSYQSMYPPMQGLILAVGDLLGNPWIGVWLACGAMVAALVWMLQAYLPPRWAVLGGFLGALHYGLLSYWMNSYWGGAHAAIGGSLVLGAIGRLRKRPSLVLSLTFGIGLAILANSRPFEGVLFTIGVLITLDRRLLRQLVIPVGIVLLAAAIGMGIYFNAVTGSPFRMPYQVNRATYGWPMTQFWLPTPVVEPSIHKPMRDYYNWEKQAHDQLRSPGALWNEFWLRVRRLWSFFLGPLLTLPLVFFGERAWRYVRTRRLAPPFLLVVAGVMAGQSATPHYLAPVAGIFLILAVQGIRLLRARRAQEPQSTRIGMFLAQAPLVMLVMIAALRPFAILPMGDGAMSWCCVTPGNTKRAEIAAQLARQSGDQLVFVHYNPDHYFHVEWVYNAADIDRAKVVWARQIDGDEDRKLLAYFHDRTAWIVLADEDPPRVMPYPR